MGGSWLLWSWQGVTKPPLRTKADYARARRIVKTVIDEWDPYSLLRHGAPADEFSHEVTAIVRLIPRINGSDDAARAVSKVFSSAFEAEYFGPEACQGVGGRLYAALVAAGLLATRATH